ncbi:unnamed protein product, partial [Schistosoma haematobium]
MICPYPIPDVNRTCIWLRYLDDSYMRNISELVNTFSALTKFENGDEHSKLPLLECL